MPYPNITTNFSSVIDLKHRYEASYINALQTAVNSIIAAMPHKQQMVVVAKARGDYTSLASAVAAITDASASKPYSILLIPGIYETSEVTLPDYVSVVGVDRKSCILKATTIDTAYVIRAGSQSIISNLSVINAGDATSSVYGINANNKTCIISDCYIEMTGARISGTIDSAGIYAITSSDVDVWDTTIYVNKTGAWNTNAGILINGGMLEARECTINMEASENIAGLSVYSGIMNVYNSDIISGGAGVEVANGTLRLENCYVEARNNNAAVLLLNASNGIFYGCTLKSNGTETNCIIYIFVPTSLKVAHCRMNRTDPIEAGLTNLITTPYNVSDTDV